MKRSRPLSLFLSVLFLIFLFPVVSLGASDNLISSDLTTWTNLSDLNTSAYPVSVTTAGDLYRVTLVDQGFSDYEYPAYLGAVLDHTSLIAGHSYSLSFKMPTLSEINSAFNKDYSQSTLNNHFKNSNIKIGVCFISPSGVFNIPEEYILFEITSDNYTNFFGKNLNASFIASSYSGTPVVTIMITSLDGTDHSFYFSNFKLVDNDDNSAELTGIKGFLHSIRWDLVGGVCSEDDCPHSSSDNPHLSLTERMSSGFASMFQSIGDKFEEGSTLNTWFTNLANKVGNVDSSISDLGDREEGFFSGLGDKIKGFFGDLGDDLDTWFVDLKKSWDQWIDDIQQTFDDVGASIENKFQEISDGFTEFFDKFKPRVSISFKWSKGYLNPSNGEFDPNNTSNASVSEYFEVLDNPYYIEFHKSQGDFVSGFYYKYDLDHNFISYRAIPADSEALILEPGYSYRFRLYRGANVTELYGDNLSKVCNELIVVYAEEGWVNALLYNAKMFVTDFFSGFGNLILYFNWDGEYTNPFEREESPIDKVSEFFDNLKSHINSFSDSIQYVIDSITGSMDVFLRFLDYEIQVSEDTFYQPFLFLKLLCGSALVLLVITRFIGL